MLLKVLIPVIIKYEFQVNSSLQKLHFSKSHFCEILQEKCDYVIIAHPKSRIPKVVKSAAKISKIGSLVK